VQVYEDMDMLTSNRSTSVVAIYGGKAYEGQIDQLKAGAQIVVGTPGRLIDLNNQRLLDLSNATEVVLDEADKMLDLGFLADIEKIFTKVAPVRHTQLFSATMPGPIVALARRFMSNPIHIRATDPDEGLTQANIKHLVYRAHSLDKDEVIARILQAEGRGKTVVFTRTKRAAQRLVDELNDRGFNAGAVHGDMSQEARERSMAGFKAGKKDVLIATDVAARGIDVDDVTHVINHTIPDDEKTYLHRAGRTGRAGKTGIAVTFVDWEDLHKWALINRALEFGQPEPVETYSSSPHLFDELDIPAGTKGRIVTAPKTQAVRVQPESAVEVAAEVEASGGEARTRRRRRRGTGGAADRVGSSFETDDGAAASHGDAKSDAPAGDSERPADGGGTHDGGGKEHHDGKPAPRRRRRRRGGSGAASGAPVGA
jgi:superfamily II DNA/RNA helicase